MMTTNKSITFLVVLMIWSALVMAVAATPPQPSVSLCARGEKTIFACSIRKPAKLISLCASPNLSASQGYIQYRFGLPRKIELEYPKSREGSQGAFAYDHYFRAQVDRTEIGFKVDGYEYAIFDDYNGEQKPARHGQGIRITAPDGKETTLSCRGRAQADYADLADVFGNTGQ